MPSTSTTTSRPAGSSRAIEERGEWHTLDADVGELHIPKFSIPAEERIEEMDAMGVDVHVLTVNTGFFKYDRPPDVARTIADECNEELSEMMRAHPDRFMGLASIPLQDVPAAIDGDGARDGRDGVQGHHDRRPRGRRDARRSAVLRRSGRPWSSSAPSCSSTNAPPRSSRARTARYGLPNVIGNLVERAITFGTLVYGGVMDRYPDLKLCLGHAGGYTAFGVARMDKGWQAGAMENMPEFEDARTFLERAPERVREPLLVRLVHVHRVDAALPPGRGGERPCRPRHGLPGADDGGRSRAGGIDAMQGLSAPAEKDAVLSSEPGPTPGHVLAGRLQG